MPHVPVQPVLSKEEVLKASVQWLTTVYNISTTIHRAFPHRYEDMIVTLPGSMIPGQKLSELSTVVALTKR